MQDETLTERTVRFIRSALTGGVATLVDLAVLTALVELAHLRPTYANVPALIAGAVTQFIGCRTVVFGAASEAVGPQVRGFVVVEAVTLALNALAFHALVTWTPIPYPLARPLGSFAIYVCFSYPMWKRVFRARSTAQPA